MSVILFFLSIVRIGAVIISQVNIPKEIEIEMFLPWMDLET